MRPAGIAPKFEAEHDRALSAPSLELEGAAWALVLWYCDAFDRTRSFRGLLAEVCSILKKERLVRLSLPPEEDGEDFVEGRFPGETSRMTSWLPSAFQCIRAGDARNRWRARSANAAQAPAKVVSAICSNDLLSAKERT